MKIYKNIKSIIPVILLLVAGAFMYQNGTAKDKATGEITPVKDNFGILLRKGNHLKVAIRTAKEINRNPRFNLGKFEIIVCGQEVDQLKKGGKLTQALAEAEALGVEVKACGISLQKFSVDASELAAGVEVVPNGLMRAFELEKEGYLMIEL